MTEVAEDIDPEMSTTHTMSRGVRVTPMQVGEECRGKIEERKGKERKGKERKGKERKGKERKGKERKGKERKGKERKGKERKGEEDKRHLPAAGWTDTCTKTSPSSPFFVLCAVTCSDTSVARCLLCGDFWGCSCCGDCDGC